MDFTMKARFLPWKPDRSRQHEYHDEGAYQDHGDENNNRCELAVPLAVALLAPVRRPHEKAPGMVRVIVNVVIGA
jgi:hypothetical protein